MVLYSDMKIVWYWNGFVGGVVFGVEFCDYLVFESVVLVVYE